MENYETNSEKPEGSSDSVESGELTNWVEWNARRRGSCWKRFAKSFLFTILINIAAMFSPLNSVGDDQLALICSRTRLSY